MPVIVAGLEEEDRWQGAGRRLVEESPRPCSVLRRA
jgi:hypothetical protein